MSDMLSNEQELASDLVACQLVIKQILDVIDVIAPTEVRDKMAGQLKSIDFSTHPAGADPVTRRAIDKAIALIEMKFTRSWAGPPQGGGVGRWRLVHHRFDFLEQRAVGYADETVVAIDVLGDRHVARRQVFALQSQPANVLVAAYQHAVTRDQKPP